MSLPGNRNEIPLPEKMKMSGLGLDYLHTDDELKLGEINNPNTPVDKAIAEIERVAGEEYGPIYTLRLGPHPCHNIVLSIGECKKSGCFTGDALIVRRSNEKFSIATFVGDCPVIIVANPTYIGFIHCGRPELMDDILPAFFSSWNNPNSDPDIVFVGPGINGKYYELPQIPNGLERFKTETIWKTQGFDLLGLIKHQLKYAGRDDVSWSGIDPYQKRLDGDTAWASDQWYKKDNVPGEQASPRDCALLTYKPRHLSI